MKSDSRNRLWNFLTSRLISRQGAKAQRLKNRKDQYDEVTVSVNENIPGDVPILNSNYSLEKTSATTWRFHVLVDQNGESVLRYRMRIKN